MAELTDEGEMFLTCAHRVLAALDELDRRFRQKPVSGVLRFGLPDNYLGVYLPDLLAKFSLRFPDIQFDVSVGMSLDLRTMLNEGTLDLAVILDVDDLLGGAVLRTEQLVWAAAETFRHVRPSLPLALYPSPCINRQVALDSLTEHGTAWHVAFTCPSPGGIEAALRSGLAVGVLCQSELTTGLRDVGEDLALPALPKGVFRLVRCGDNVTEAARELEKLVLHSTDAEAG